LPKYEAKNVIPSRITLGCMGEALASNNDPEGAGNVQQELYDAIRRIVENLVFFV
jgi:hypothetical protein